MSSPDDQLQRLRRSIDNVDAVLFNKDGLVLEARRGQVVSVTAEVAERGEGLGALAPLTDG